MIRLIEFIKLWFELRKNQAPVQVKVQAATTPNIIPIKKSMPKTNSQKLYDTAKSLLGQHLSGDNSFLGCATTVNEIARRALGNPIGGGASTALLFQALKNTAKYEQVSIPTPGCIVISPTGTSNLGPQQHGHCGVVAMHGILSNSSEDGCLHENYTVDTWNKVFHGAFKFPVYYFEVL